MTFLFRLLNDRIEYSGQVLFFHFLTEKTFCRINKINNALTTLCVDQLCQPSSAFLQNMVAATW